MAVELIAKKGKKDAYANVAYGIVTMSAANTLTFAQIQFAVGLFQGIALLLHRVLWYPTNTACREMVAATDEMQLGLTTSNRLTGIGDVSEPAVISFKRIMGIGVDVTAWHLPLIMDYTMLPGGGKLIPANPIYCAMYTAGAAAASGARVQLEFTFIELQAADYLELIQAQYPANIS